MRGGGGGGERMKRGDKRSRTYLVSNPGRVPRKS